MDGRSIDVIIEGDGRSGIIGVRICRMYYAVRMEPDRVCKSTHPLFCKCEYSITSCEKQLHSLCDSLPLFIFLRSHFGIIGLRRRRCFRFGFLERNVALRDDGENTSVGPI